MPGREGIHLGKARLQAESGARSTLHLPVSLHPGRCEVKRHLVIAALLVALPLAGAAKCNKNCNTGMGDCNPRPSAPAPEKSHCVMTENGCVSPPARS